MSDSLFSIALTCRFFIFVFSYIIANTGHLVGIKGDGSSGHKIMRIESITSCKVRISSKDHPMKIDITSNLARNIAQGVSMIEHSLMEFISDENSEKRMLYELISTAEGSYNFKRNDGCRMLLREYAGIKSWWALFELPYKEREDGGEYHGKFLQKLRSKLPIPGDCIIELFGGDFGAPLEHASPFVLIRGTKHKDVKEAVSMVRHAMKRHQVDKGCDCTPKWAV